MGDLVERILPVENPSRVDETTAIGTWLYGKSKSTVRYYKRVLREFFQFYPKLAVRNVTTAHVTVFLKHKNQSKPSSRNTEKLVLSSFFEYCVQTDVMAKNPCRLIKNEKVPSRLHEKVMSIEEIASIKSVLKERKTPKDEKLSPRDEMLVDVAYHLGLRVAELCSLKVSSFVPSENGGTMWVVGKGSKVRGVAVTESLGKRLLSYIRDMGLKSGDPLFISQKGDREPLTTSAIYRVLVGAGVKAKIARPAHPHRFRHSSAAHAVENGAPIDVVKNTLGHSDISSTGQYLNLKPKKSNAHFLPDIE